MTPVKPEPTPFFKPNRPGQRIKRYLIAGLLVWLPLGVTVMVMRFIFGLLNKGMQGLPVKFKLESLLGFDFPGLQTLFFMVFVVVVLLATGAFVANLFGRQFVGASENVLNRIPIVRTIYNSTKQISETIFSDTSNSFKKVLLVEYPRKGLWCIGFQTSSQLGEVQARTGRRVVCVFVPTTPNPTSGFIIMVPVEELIELDMNVDAAIKMVISMGVIVPPWTGDTPPDIAPPPRAT